MTHSFPTRRSSDLRVGSRLYRRPEPGDGGPVRWEIATLSLQTLLEVPVHVGGMTALELAGYWHYAPLGRRRVWLYTDEIGRAHVCTPVTNAHRVCRLLLGKKHSTHTE